VFRGGCYFSRREEKTEKNAGSLNRQQTELVATRELGKSGKIRDFEQTVAKADYLDYAKRAANSAVEKQMQDKDSDVGFPGSMKGAAKMEQSKMNLGQASVSGVWSYQGSKPIVADGKFYIAIGKTLECLTPETGKIVWKKALGEAAKDGPRSGETVDAEFAPPAAVNGKLFLGTRAGRVMCVSAAKGDTLWTTDVGEPIVFQPAVANGRIYFGTAAGSLIAIETGDAKDDGWLMWGANAAHDGLPARKVR
jgi:outer membrane protein assembly factor BamB